MEYITLKNTDLQVSRVCMGGCPMGGHGWGNVQEQELLDAVTPERVLISLSEDNNYGHPDPMLLERLTERGIEVFRTDIHGTIEIGR